MIVVITVANCIIVVISTIDAIITIIVYLRYYSCFSNW